MCVCVSRLAWQSKARVCVLRLVESEPNSKQGEKLVIRAATMGSGEAEREGEKMLTYVGPLSSELCLNQCTRNSFTAYHLSFYPSFPLSFSISFPPYISPYPLLCHFPRSGTHRFQKHIFSVFLFRPKEAVEVARESSRYHAVRRNKR